MSRTLPHIRSELISEPAHAQPIMVLKDPVPRVLSGRWAMWLNTLPLKERFDKQEAAIMLWMEQEGLTTSKPK